MCGHGGGLIAINSRCWRRCHICTRSSSAPNSNFGKFCTNAFTGLCAAGVAYCRYRQVKDQILPRCHVLRVEVDGARG